ncbi:MAG: hypothetical protein OXI57_04130 [Rhodospirillales bacterium]|nr:hypothetical protein [Rhodospirillales bacterium]
MSDRQDRFGTLQPSREEVIDAGTTQYAGDGDGACPADAVGTPVLA